MFRRRKLRKEGNSITGDRWSYRDQDTQDNRARRRSTGRKQMLNLQRRGTNYETGIKTRTTLLNRVEGNS